MRPKEKPFCYWFGSHQPHRNYPRDCGVKHGLDPAKVVVPPYLPDSDVVRRDICDYYYQSEEFDRQPGECLAAVEKIGEMDNTLIVISGDNGWPFARSKATLYDTGTHQPLAICWPGYIQPGRTIDDFVSLADSSADISRSGRRAPCPATMTGRSLLDVLLSGKSGQVDPARDHVLTMMERHAPNGRKDGDQENVGYPKRSILTKEFHYIRNFKPDRWPAGDPPAVRHAGLQRA